MCLEEHVFSRIKLVKISRLKKLDEYNAMSERERGGKRRVESKQKSIFNSEKANGNINPRFILYVLSHFA